MLDKALLISGAVGCGLISLFTFIAWIAWIIDIPAKDVKVNDFLWAIVAWFFIVTTVFLVVMANG